MVVDLEDLPPLPTIGQPRVATVDDRADVVGWVEQHWPNWTSEVVDCLDRGRLAIAHDADGVVAVCCWDGARTGWVGPVAVRPSAIGRGQGRSVLIAALHELRRAGRHRAEIGWVGPIRPYAQTVSAVVNRVFFVYRRRRPAAS
jgi:GNAT superfamily N-acetyltransferase